MHVTPSIKTSVRGVFWSNGALHAENTPFLTPACILACKTHVLATLVADICRSKRACFCGSDRAVGRWAGRHGPAAADLWATACATPGAQGTKESLPEFEARMAAACERINAKGKVGDKCKVGDLCRSFRRRLSEVVATGGEKLLT